MNEAKRGILFVLSLIALICSATGSANRLGNGRDQTEVNKERFVGQTTGIVTADTAAPLTAIAELEKASLVKYERAHRQSGHINLRFHLSSLEAQAYRLQLTAEHDEFKSAAKTVAPSLHINTECKTLLNAVSIEASAEELVVIAKLPGVRRLRLTKEYRAMLNRSVPLIHAPAMWQQLGGATVAGQGIKIAILDSGIDITNPLFSDSGYVAPAGFPRGDDQLTNNKVIVAKAFLTDIFATPADEFGHGSHVAGIAAGNFNTPSPLAPLSGVAPRAFLGNYRVLDRGGSGRDDFIIRALEEAVEDGFDVINMSFGASAENLLGPLDEAVENAVAAGAVVVVAAGNDGANGESTISSPGIAPSAITVGASTNTRVIGPGVSIVLSGPAPLPFANVEATRGESDRPSAALDRVLGPLPLLAAGSASDRGCTAQSIGELSGDIALIERGSCPFSDKINLAEKAGARAAIIFNQQETDAPDAGDNLLFMEVNGTSIPSAFVRRSDGLALGDWLRSNPNAQVSLAPVPVVELTAPADELTGYSSRGPSAIGGLKPDLSAPGDSIYSAAIRDGSGRSISDPSGFAVAGGTSQATPHVAGAAALLKQMHPSWPPAQIKSALMNSATKLNSSNAVIEAGVLDAGAGRLDLSGAATASATLSPASISLGFIHLKKSDVQFTTDLRVTNVASGQNEFVISAEPANAEDEFHVTPRVESISLEPGQTTTVKIKFRAVSGVTQSRDYTGYIVLTTRTGQVLREPYWVRFVKKN